MKPTFVTLYWLILLCFCAQGAIGQQIKVGRVKNRLGVSVPFAIITTGDNLNQVLSDADGFFTYKTDAITLSIKHPEFEPVTFQLPTGKPGTDTITCVLEQQQPLFMPPGANRQRAEKIIDQLLQQKDSINPARYRHSFFAYHKLTVRATRLEAPGFLRKFTGRFLQLFHDFSHYAPHLFLMEAVTRREYHPGRVNKETIIATNATGVSQTSLLTPTSTLQPFNIFANLFENPSYRFISPLGKNPKKRYRYSIADSLMIAGAQKVYLVNFKPKRRYSFDVIEGTFYVEAATGKLLAITGKESGKKTLPLQFAQSFMYTEGVIFPERLTLRFELLTGSKSEKAYIAELSTLVQEPDVHKTATNQAFDPVYLTSRDAEEPSNQSYWDNYRFNTFTSEDKQTLVLYDSLGNRKQLNYLIRFAEKITTGQVPAGKVDINLYKLLRYNEHEGFRPGLGLITNQSFSEKFRAGAYAGFGVNDREWKMNGKLGYRLKKKSDTWVWAGAGKELEESGLPYFSFPHDQFSSEWLRSLRVRKMDELKSADFWLTSHPLRDVQVQAGASFQERKPLFTYSFIPLPEGVFSITEIGVGARFAFREQFIETSHYRHTIGSRWPILFLQVRKGIEGLADGELNYWKTDAKIAYSIRNVSLGTSSLQVIAGYVQGKVPYGLLFSGKGSLRHLSVVNHNSFETMRYNEFLSDNYAGLFLSHQFGKLLPGAKGFEPTLELLHNMGIGSLRNPEFHQGLGFRTMEKGYFESGFFVNDVFVFRLYLLKISSGAGLFLRYGPYALPDAAENAFLKFSLTFGL